MIEFIDSVFVVLEVVVGKFYVIYFEGVLSARIGIKYFVVDFERERS